MKRFVNVRLAVVAAFGIGCGAVCGYLCSCYGISRYPFIALIPVTAALLIIFILKHSIKFTVLTAITALLFAAGFFGFTYKINSYTSGGLTDGGTYTVSGYVYEKGYTDDGEYVKLKNLYADGLDADGKMYVYLSEGYGDFCDVGYTVSFSATVYSNDAFAYGVISSSRLVEGLRYTAYVTGGLTSSYGFSLFGSVNRLVRGAVFNNMDADTAAVSYAMLTGNSDYVEEGTSNSFSYGGIAHIFAVSGLHIGLVYGAACFIFKKLRFNKYLSAGLTLALIIFYAGVCGFTLSSVRAVVMCGVASLVRLVRGKYDMLSSLSIAFIVLLLINPLNIMSAGFKLSVAAVAGIALLCGSIQRALRRIKVPRKIASATAVALAAQTGTFPMLLATFGYVSWASLLMNIIFVPLLSLQYTLLFVCTLLSLVISPLSAFFMGAAGAPLSVIMSAVINLKLESTLISGFEFGWFAVIYYAAVFFISDKVNFNLGVRAGVTGVIAAFLLLCLVVVNVMPSGRLRVAASAYYNDSAAVLFKTSDASVLVINETPSSYDVSVLLRKNGVRELTAIIILGGDESVFAYTLCGQECADLYVYYDNLQFQPYNGVTVHYEKTFEISGVTYTFKDYGNLTAKYSGITTGINMYGDVAFTKCNLLIAENADNGCNATRYVYFRQVSGYDNIYDDGDLQFIIKGGKLYA